MKPNPVNIVCTIEQNGVELVIVRTIEFDENSKQDFHGWSIFSSIGEPVYMMNGKRITKNQAGEWYIGNRQSS